MRGSPGGLRLIRELVANGAWDFSDHLLGRLDSGDCTEADLEQCVLTGRVRKREKDERGEAVDGNKYTILGRGAGGLPFYVVGKILMGGDGNYFFFITAHGAE